MKPTQIASWLLAVGLAGALTLLVGLPKFFGPEPNPIFALIAGRTGIGLFEPALRYATGVAELAAAFLLIVPRTRFYGAALAGAVTLGAIGFHLSPFLGVEIPQMDQLVPLVQAGRTIADIDAMGLPTDGGALFATALAFLAGSIALIWIDRPR